MQDEVEEEGVEATIKNQKIVKETKDEQ